MTKKEECLKALQCLYLEVDASIADDVKQKVLEALDEANKKTVDFAKWLWSADNITHIGGDRWGIEKMDSIELEEKEYTIEDLYKYWETNINT